MYIPRKRGCINISIEISNNKDRLDRKDRKY